MRLGLFGLRKKILETSELEINSLYMFCSMNRNQIKIIEITNTSSWLYQNKLVHGKFIWPMKGDKAELSKDELKLIIEGAGLIKSIENKGQNISFHLISPLDLLYFIFSDITTFLSVSI